MAVYNYQIKREAQKIIQTVEVRECKLNIVVFGRCLWGGRQKVIKYQVDNSPLKTKLKEDIYRAIKEG